MKVFLFSRRFLVPLLIIWILHLIYVEWEMWRLWKDDLTGKGLPTSLKFEWLLIQASGYIMPLSFLVSFLIAMIIYSHYRAKKEKHISPDFFSTWNLLSVIFLAVIAFLYTSFIEPRSNLKSQELLAEIIWAKSYDELKDGLRNPKAGKSFKGPGTMTITELFHAKDSLKATYNIKEEYDFPYLNKDQRVLRKIQQEINKKISLPFTVILFYFIGLFLGASFYKIHVIDPLLIGYLILFVSWYYIRQVFERLYFKEDVEGFLGSNAATMFFGLLAIAWFLVLRKYEFFTEKNNDPETPGSINFDNSGIE